MSPDAVIVFSVNAFSKRVCPDIVDNIKILLFPVEPWPNGEYNLTERLSITILNRYLNEDLEKFNNSSLVMLDGYNTWYNATLAEAIKNALYRGKTTEGCIAVAALCDTVYGIVIPNPYTREFSDIENFLYAD